MSDQRAEIGIIGGSGLYALAAQDSLEEVAIETPFGEPSGSYKLGEVAGRKVAFLARHGEGHRLSPSEINYRANIWGMKALGVQRIVSASAVGSLKLELEPRHFVVVCHDVTAQTAAGLFSVSNLLQGRVDVWCRCIVAGLYLSDDVRADTAVSLVLVPPEATGAGLDPSAGCRVVTVAGMVTAHLGRPAEVGDELTIGNVHLRVIHLHGRRVDRLRLTLLDDSREDAA